MNTVVLASSNPGKLREINQILSTLNLTAVPQSDFKVPNVDESGSTFAENALLKARHASHHTGLPAIADDSGIEVDCLHGAPGVYSARYAGPNASDAQNVQKLLDVLKSVPDAERSARFQCVMVYLRDESDPEPIICQGTWEGKILDDPRGMNGFGYDPVFFVPTHKCSAAELPPEVKNKLSHRGQALRALVAMLGRTTL